MALVGTAVTTIARLGEGLRREPRRWLVTGCAGFIGSHLVEVLLRYGQHVVGLDNFATGFRRNLDDVRQAVGEADWARFRFIEGDIRDLAACEHACRGIDVVLHQAALGSVPRSVEDPLSTHGANVDGFVNMLLAARSAGVKRFVYASSSAVYGDDPRLPKSEGNIGRPLSPYAASKCTNELYADVFARCYGIETVGLRYFNVFGARQDPSGPYAAVIPRWIDEMLGGRPVAIYGDGETTRDFCYIANAVQANLLAATTRRSEALNQVYNVAVGERTSLNELFSLLRSLLAERFAWVASIEPEYRDFRPGDIRHSLADVSKARQLLGYEPTHAVLEGLREALPWYLRRLRPVPGPGATDC
ncbi:SDR family oxidoreductase [Pelomicrobium methylotrophicum]|uniref:SDR family oxidoreductase n=1 Tax=Pelomicrobium methylotrophicum TaxID=2602750 RepID=A0A5C7EI44_9PROT|nr:SDR family oxidoreductase [Pelomicrobium methylotrophicum]